VKAAVLRSIAPSGVSQNATPDREQRRTAVFAGYQE